MSEKLELKDYLHFYFGCEVHLFTIMASGRKRDDGIKKLNSEYLYQYSKGNADIQLPLRPLSDMSEEERYQYSKHNSWRGLNGHEQNARATKYLCECGIDAFGLIDAGIAVDKTKLPK